MPNASWIGSAVFPQLTHSIPVVYNGPPFLPAALRAAQAAGI